MTGEASAARSKHVAGTANPVSINIIAGCA